MTTETQTTYEAFAAASKENQRLLHQERLILDVTEALCDALRGDGVKQIELAERLGKTKGYVSQLLGGGRNLTLRTLSDIAEAMGYRVRLRLSRLSGRQIVASGWSAENVGKISYMKFRQRERPREEALLKGAA